ncbi:ser/thr protein phosphatase family-like protein [Cercophora newfieldiana]|uniref:Ser/thr protein phosphatase family-like protein n=1 Tax=Cercophora newfieldiana TaxID=92897 RepID=A0AA39YNP0_9PEZI|nr:ser/thr protein phosphatase family-like protein [Cercophora newfieldiana]
MARIRRWGVIVAALVGGIAAMQPHAQMPAPAPMRDLTWGKLNFLQTTDTHGWLGGHLTEPSYSADWGDYVSLAHHMRKQADERGVDLLLVDAGDRIEGNGLYDGSNPKGLYLYDIYRQQDIDIICTGNHELYKSWAIQDEHRYTVPNYQNNYIASNLDYINITTGKQEPMAPRYRKFKTKNQGLEILAFGFLFNFSENNKTLSVVQRVEETVKEPWFQDAIREDPDVFVVNGHVGVEMSEFNNTIYKAIRDVNPTTPIVFLGGHVHLRNATMYDERAIAVASGRYFETIGWVSLDGPLKKDEVPSPQPRDAGKITFSRRYIDTNLLGFYHHTGLNGEAFETERGRNTSNMIAHARNNMRLEELYGCAPQSYWMTRFPYGHKNNLYTLLANKILPYVAYDEQRVDIPRLVLINTGAMRFDIFKGRFTRDSMFNVSPFPNKFRYIPNMPYKTAKFIFDVLLSWESYFTDQRPYLMMLGIPTCELNIRRETFIAPKDVLKLASRSVGQARLSGYGEPEIVEGHTTVDGLGNDGDDTLHWSYDYHTQPAVVKTEMGVTEGEEPETIDFVFIDFMKGPLSQVFKRLNTTYTEADMLPYGTELLDVMVHKWVKENWSQEC